MKIETTRFGSQEFTQDTILHFPKGLLNDSQLTEFKLFHKETDQENSSDNPVVFWLQSVKQPNVAYTIFDPSLANFYYQVALPDEDFNLLKSDQGEEDEIIMMVIIKDSNNNDIKQDGLTLVNANITEPLFINLQSLKGIQRSIKDLDYDIFLNVPVISQ